MQIAAQLHDCGKYISMGDVAECSYRIIMATEIIGLSTEERKIIANAVRYNTTDFVSYEMLKDEETGLDRSHNQKVKGIKAVLKERELQLVVDSDQDISLELGLLKDKVQFFEEVFGVRLVLRRKRKM